MSVEARLEPGPFNPALELEKLMKAASGDGAIVSFVGVTRPKSNGGESVEQLVLEHHPKLTLQSLEQIAADAAERFDVGQLRVVHRCGAVVSGEPIVFAAAAAKHRRAAFEAADYLMDRLKTEAVFWKQETSGGGSTWIEPTASDYDDRQRWE